MNVLTPDELVHLLNNRDAQPKHPFLRPRPAATLILVDRRSDEPKVLMGRRNDKVRFMPGKFVFPGGGIEPGDRQMNIAGPLHAAVETRLMAERTGGTTGFARAIALAAIRETFEETGLLLGSREYGAPENPPEGAWAKFAANEVFPTLDNMQYVARAITPPGRPRRFDANFFCQDASTIVGQVEGVVGPDSELVELAWLTVADAIKLDLPSMTLVVLHELQRRAAAGMSPLLPVPFYREVRGRWVRTEL